MKKHNKVQEPVSFSKSEYDELRSGMKKYKDAYEGKHMFTAFHRYLREKGIVSFDEENGLAVINPLQYTRYNDMRAKIQNYDDAKLKEVLDTMPEEKEAWAKKISTLFSDWRQTRAKMKA